MVGDRRMGALGTVMLPIKAIDTAQPIYGLTAFALLLVYAATRQTATLGPVAVVLPASSSSTSYFTCGH